MVVERAVFRTRWVSQSFSRFVAVGGHAGQPEWSRRVGFFTCVLVVRLVKSWLSSLTHCFLGSRLPPSSLGPVPCALAGAQVAGPWGQRGTTLVMSMCPAGLPSTSSLKLCPGSWQGSCQCRHPDFRESSGSSGQRGWSACQMKGPPPP